MLDNDKSVFKALVAIAWADGRFAAEETSMLEALLAAFDASPADAAEMWEYAGTPRSLDEVDMLHLTLEDRKRLLDHATVLTLIDGEQLDHEQELLQSLATRLKIDPAESGRIIDAARERALQLLSLL